MISVLKDKFNGGGQVCKQVGAIMSYRCCDKGT